MASQAQSNNAATKGEELAKDRMLHKIAVTLAIVAVLVLATGFYLTWPAYYQVAAGLAAWAAVEWQRTIDRRLKQLNSRG